MSDHGASKYNDDHCRCDVCTAGNTARGMRRRRERRRHTAEHGLPASVAHGYSAYVNWGCRCDVCTAACSAQNAAAYQKRRAS